MFSHFFLHRNLCTVPIFKKYLRRNPIKSLAEVFFLQEGINVHYDALEVDVEVVLLEDWETTIKRHRVS